MTPDAAAAILNVPTSATREEVTRAFNLRARMTHPDRFAGAPQGDVDAAAAEFIRVTAARDALLEAVAKRERVRGEQSQEQPQAAQEPRQSARRDPPMTFEEFVTQRERAAWRQRPAATPPPGARPSAAPGASPNPNRTPTRSRSQKGVWWAICSVVGALVLVACVLAALTTHNDNRAQNTMVPATLLDAGGGVSVQVDSSGDGWTWTLTSDTDCPDARVDVSFSDTADSGAFESYSDSTSLKAGTPQEYSVPDSASKRQYASLDSVTCH